jgi:hypothetical protein
MLSLKTAQERPTLKRFATEYTTIIQDIITSETTISQLSEESDDISQVLKQHNETLTSEFKSSSENFEIIFNDIIQRESTGSPLSLLISAVQGICWLRLISIILNPHPSKLTLVKSFAENSRIKAQQYLSQNIADVVSSIAKHHLLTRSWDSIPEKSLWEGMFLTNLV